ncbi:winged helix-turn-helix domain-containing protein [Halorarius litoreus]|jgi:predicted transcriptional regulator|uniref:winged helix-turn-helix domain-containing protein n=1 Tax=Halorarius litoreus TaxID=2962676 RepID=UPI0020CE4BF5|nr:helix-turn-helix domain-containing protein [Halorarius litoreus]
MDRDPATGDASPSLQDILTALDDPDCRTILRETAEPMTANDLIDACGIPKSTLYRKLNRLSDAALVREQDEINPGGGRTTRYVRDFKDVNISMDNDDEFSVTVERPHRNVDERLEDIWSKMGEGL